MDIKNGEWIIKGLDISDPKCLKTPQELEKLIDEIGFIPFLAGNVAGFSVEEITASKAWFTGNPEDPWEWREILASSGKIAYGKLFSKRAGFISKKWYPVFANYRRDGYDFDSLYEDGKAHYRSKLIMDLFEREDYLLSNMIKELAGFGKGKEKGFEGALANLQMQTYLINSGFSKRINKKGEEYGWSVAGYSTPEKVFGEDFVRSEYDTSSKESFEKIFEHVRKSFPKVDEKSIIKEIK